MKKRNGILALLLLLGMFATGLVSCRRVESDVPEGYTTATCYGADYRLYVPSTWTVNNTFGVSAAYRNAVELSSVSLHKYEITEEIETGLAGREDRLLAYWETVLLPVFRAEATGDIHFVDEDSIYTLLGGANALQRHVTAEVNGQLLHCMQVVAERNRSFYVLTYLANDAYYKVSRSEVDGMIANFVFSETPYQAEDYAWQLEDDPNVPAGMQAAYSKEVPYRFYVPQNWVVDRDRLISSGWDPVDRANVSVLFYSPDESMGIREYFEKEEKSLTDNGVVRNYTRLSESESEIGGRKCMVYEFSCEIGGTVLYYRQYLAIWKSRICCVTYTATETAFGAHLGELQTIVDSFSFR